MLSSFPHLSAVCLDRHLSDHRPILLREVFTDYGPTPFRFYHAWFRFEGFDQMVFTTWNNIALDDRNVMIRFKKKLQLLKKEIRIWIGNYKKNHAGHIDNLRANLKDIDKIVDSGDANDDILLSRVNLLKEINDFQASNTREGIQKAKIKWAVEGDENSKFFHGVINRRRANLEIKGVMVDGEWVDDPTLVKEEFKSHFASRFQTPTSNRCCLNFTFPKRLDTNQAEELEGPISIEEVRKAVWGCGDNKSPGIDGFTFEFFRKYWDLLGADLYDAVVWFFDKGSFARGCNTSFITLIPKIQDPKFVSDYRPISLIGCLYKVITKILANRISLIIPDLISDYKKQQAMVFKVDFAKAYDSVRWDFLQDILTAFGFGSKWCSWIRGCLQTATASVLLNGSPTSEFHFECGLKQGDPLAPFLFILVMETLHLSFVRATEAGIFTGLKIGTSFSISHLFYADDAVFIGEWSNANLSGITKILHCFSLLSGLNINLKKSHLLGVGIANEVILAAAENLGCATMKTPFKYLGVMVGGNCAKVQAWEDTISKVKARLSNWKLKALSIGGRFTLLRSVLGSTPIYNMSIYKMPNSNGVAERKNSVLQDMINVMLVSANLPKNLWGEALLTSCHVSNRIITKKLKVSPYEIWKGRKPNISYFRVWGCLSYYKVPLPNTSKLGPRGLKSVFVGYAKDSKSYRCLDLDSNVIVESRDVDFFENKFSHDLTRTNEIMTQIPQDIFGPNLNSNNKRNMAESSSAPRRSERARKDRNLDPDFIDSQAIIFHVEGDNENNVINKIPVLLNVEDAPKTYKETITSRNSAFWKEAINDEMDPLVSNNT
ncbi:RNA-directed DNA polymerase, eukaryota [Tanacetum coccineum]